MHTCEKVNKDVRMSPYRIRKAKLRYSDEPNKLRLNKAIRFNHNKVQPQKDISVDMYAMWVTHKKETESAEGENGRGETIEYQPEINPDELQRDYMD